jgi:hypothetical protein
MPTVNPNPEMERPLEQPLLFRIRWGGGGGSLTSYMKFCTLSITNVVPVRAWTGLQYMYYGVRERERRIVDLFKI